VRHFPHIASLVLLIAPVTITSAAQSGTEDRQYLNAVLAPTTKKNAAYYRIAESTAAGAFIGKTYAMDGSLKAEGPYADAALTIEHGEFTFFHANGKVESKGAYAMGQKTGVWMRYDVAGNRLAEKVYNPEALANIIYTRAQTMPKYPNGGERELVRYIKDQVGTSSDGRRQKASMTASFIVEKDGRLSDVKVVERKGAEVDGKVVDAIRSTAPWEPGQEKGQPVRVQVKLPVQF